MTTRHNTCINPALANDVSGWAGGSTPVQTTVTGFGRTTAARYTTGTFLTTASGAAVPASTYTLSAYVRSASFSISGNLYIEWLNAGAGVISDTAGSPYSAPLNTVTRLSITGVAPALTASCRLILDGVNFAVTTCDVTMLLIEQVGTLDTYFDGATPGATWDGTPGNSASTLGTFVAGSPMPIQGELNRLAHTTGLGEAGAANVYAGTTGLTVVGALNAKAGTKGLGLQGVANVLAGTTGLGVCLALSLIATPP